MRGATSAAIAAINLGFQRPCNWQMLCESRCHELDGIAGIVHIHKEESLSMDRLIIRYTVKRDQIERHLELLRAVYQELESAQPDHFRYATYQLEDGISFVDVVIGADLPGPLPRLESFQRYRADLDERCDERTAVEFQEVGSFRFHQGLPEST